MKILKIDYHSPNAGKELVESFKNTGFAVITNHDIPKKLLEDTYAEWEQFFKSSEKMNYKFDPKTQSGFFPFKSENAKDSAVKDLKEFFHIHKPEDYPHDVIHMVHSVALQRHLNNMGEHLISLIEKESPQGIFQSSESLISMINPENKTLFRILHYPPLELSKEAIAELRDKRKNGFTDIRITSEPVEEGAVRAAAHEDINLITLLPAATQAGLEVKDVEGNWHAVQSDFGNIIVNVGDMLQLASQGFFKSTTHRVVNPKGAEAQKSRYSMPLFIHPRPDVKLSPTKTAEEYLNERLAEISLKK